MLGPSLAKPLAPSQPVGDALLGRVRRGLDSLGDFAHLHVRSAGNHIVLESRASDRARAPLARLTALGRDAFGLSFYGEGGAWEPMVLIDVLDEIVVAMMGGIDMSFDPVANRSAGAA